MTTEYVALRQTSILPRLPLEGNIDITYRCNNNCRHCWLRIPVETDERKGEITFGEIKKIVADAKMMGCRKWFISGGEPILRPDFPEIFDYVTKNSISYSINTNGTLITPKIAALLRKKGVKMVALYGATADVHDHITRNPGSFEATMRGFAYLKEAGAGFIVQIIPMKDNYHQFKEMIRLAGSLSKHHRIGAPWLYLSACGDLKKNDGIKRQRLLPKEAIELDKPDLSYEELIEAQYQVCHQAIASEYLFSSCIANRRDFHIDAYAQMTFCCFIKDPALRYDLRKGNFRECWEEFIPALANRIKVSDEYKKNCGSCKLKKDCRYCAVYSYLEHRKFNVKVDYLCAMARENRKFKENWKKNHRRYYKIADITIQVESDLPITENTFHSKFKLFEININADSHRLPASPAGRHVDTRRYEADISIRHYFSLPDLDVKKLGREVYRKPPWAIYKSGNSWIYLGISSREKDKRLHQVAVFNHDHTRVRIYNDKENTFLKGELHSLTLFPTDQILLARILANRKGCYLHSCGVNFNGNGLLFAGHSEAGKSTMAALLKDEAEILCDDRIIIRKYAEGFKIYGTWSHGDIPDVSPAPASLKAILFLEKADENRAIQLRDKKEIVRRLIECLIKPFMTVDWWDKSLSLIDKIATAVPSYVLRFNRNGEVVKVLKDLIKN